MSRIACGTKLAVLALAGSIFIAPLAYAKHASFDMPACDKLFDGDGPTVTKPATRGVGSPADKTVSSTPKGKAPKASNSLAPMTLNDDAEPIKVGEDGKVKLEVQQNNEVQAEGPATVDPTASASVVGNDDKLKAKLLKDSTTAKLNPIALQETDGETAQKENTISESEKAQLSDLWTSTINRSPDIQFVINKLQPQSGDGSHATATAMKMIGGALFSIVQMAPMMMPGGASANMGMYMATGSSASILSNLMGSAGDKAAKKQQISQEQATMLYKIVRDTAEKVVIEYRKYRQTRSDYTHASDDLADLKTMVASASGRNDPAKAIEMEYTLRKAQRDVQKIIDEAKLHKQQLVDLAGGDAVGRLDQQMDDEATALAKLVGNEGAPAEDAPADAQVATDAEPNVTATAPKNPLNKPLAPSIVQTAGAKERKDGGVGPL